MATLRIRTSDGVELAASDEGHGESVVVLSHAMTGTRNDWRLVVPCLLARGWRVVSFDQRGHGQSGRGPVSVERLALDIQEIVEHLDLSRLALVGHSSGGYALLALEPPFVRRRVRSMVVVSTTPAVTSLRERATLRYARTTLAARLQAWRVPGRLLVRLGAFGQRPSHEAVEWTRLDSAACPRETRRAFVDALLTAPDLSRRLRALGCPVTAVVGSRDRLVRPGRAARIAEETGGRHVVLEGRGHMLVYEAPEELCTTVNGAAAM
jgi:non-heme chloroperoxidase